MLKSVFGVSDDLDPLAGVRHVVAECRSQLGSRTPQAGFFFTSCMDTDYASMLAEIHREFPEIKLIGCTTDGEITSLQGFTEESSALLIFYSETISFGIGVAEDLSGDPEPAMRAGYEQAMADLGAEPTAAFVLPDGITTMQIPVDAHLQSVFGDQLPVFGGMAGDGFRIRQTYQFCGNRVFTDAMPVLLLGGEIDISADIARGPRPYGEYYTVDRAADNIAYSIDGVTALEFYERFLGEYLEDREVSFFPLAVYVDGSDDFMLRDPVEIDRKDGSMTFVGHVEESSRVRLTQVTREETLRSAQRGAVNILSAFAERQPDLVLLFSCTSRRHVLGSRTDEEYDGLRSSDQAIPFFGFYCYGEIGSFAPGKPVKFHSDTCVFVALRSARP